MLSGQVRTHTHTHTHIHTHTAPGLILTHRRAHVRAHVPMLMHTGSSIG